jgi:hypothetical protein
MLKIKIIRKISNLKLLEFIERAFNLN